MPRPTKSRFRREWKRLVCRFCDVWLRASNRAEKTIDGYRADLLQFSKYVRSSPTRTDRIEIEGWIARLQQEQYSANSIRRKLASLRALFRYLVDSKQMRWSPLRDLRIRLGTTKRLTRVLNRKDFIALVHAADRQASRFALRRLLSSQRLPRLRNALMVRLMLLTGMRVGEMVALHVTDVQQRERSIIVHGKGNRERLAFVSDTDTALLMDRYLKLRLQHFPDLPSLFINDSGMFLHTESVRRILRHLGHGAGIQNRVTPHMLRHTSATTLLETGANLRIVQEFLGHSSIRSTERYTHVSQGHLRKVLRKLNPLKKAA